jgi:hypothetical protein
MDANKWNETGTLAIIVTVLVIVASFLVGKIADFLSVSNTLIGGAIIFVLFATVVFLANRFAFVPIRAAIAGDATKVETKLKVLSSSIDAMASIYKADWLITSRRLRELEEEVQSDHIWIITGGLEEELDDKAFGAVIAKNIARGLTYTYFVPDTPIVRGRIAKMRLTHKNSPRLQFRIIKTPLFNLVAAQDLAIYGALDPNAGRLTGYMNLPIRQGGSEYFILLGPQYAEQIVAELMAQPFDTAQEVFSGS